MTTETTDQALWDEAKALNEKYNVPEGQSYIPLDLIVHNNEILPRIVTNDAQVEAYMAVFDFLPPIIVRRETTELIAGQHRIKAARRLGHTHALAELRSYDTDYDAWVDAWDDNARNGVVYSAPERRAALAKLMANQHPYAPENPLSVKELVRRTGLSEATVIRRIREDRKKLLKGEERVTGIDYTDNGLPILGEYREDETDAELPVKRIDLEELRKREDAAQKKAEAMAAKLRQKAEERSEASSRQAPPVVDDDALQGLEAALAGARFTLDQDVQVALAEFNRLVALDAAAVAEDVIDVENTLVMAQKVHEWLYAFTVRLEERSDPEAVAALEQAEVEASSDDFQQQGDADAPQFYDENAVLVDDERAAAIASLAHADQRAEADEDPSDASADSDGPAGLKELLATTPAPKRRSRSRKAASA